MWLVHRERKKHALFTNTQSIYHIGSYRESPAAVVVVVGREDEGGGGGGMFCGVSYSASTAVVCLTRL